MALPGMESLLKSVGPVVIAWSLATLHPMQVRAQDLSSMDRGEPNAILPATVEARAALFAPLSSSNLAAYASTRPAGEPMSCTKSAAFVGAVAAAAGLLLAALIDSWIPTGGRSTRYYVFAGGTMFVGGAAYTAVRCALERD